MSPARVCTAAEAAALVRPRDALGVPLGPGQPTTFLHALGERDDWEELVVHGALLIDLFLPLRLMFVATASNSAGRPRLSLHGL